MINKQTVQLSVTNCGGFLIPCRLKDQALMVDHFGKGTLYAENNDGRFFGYPLADLLMISRDFNVSVVE